MAHALFFVEGRVDGPVNIWLTSKGAAAAPSGLWPLSAGPDLLRRNGDSRSRAEALDGSLVVHVVVLGRRSLSRG